MTTKAAETAAPAVYGAIAAVMADLAKEGIGKDRRNQQQGYNFRGIDDVYNALAPILAKHSLVITPRCLSREVCERTTAKGGVLFYVTVDMEFVLACALDGSTVTARTFGEAMDSGDKATNKAQSAAFKYMAMQQFCIPTEGDNDADGTTHEVAPKLSQVALVAINTMEAYQRDPAAFKEFWTTNKDSLKANLDGWEYEQVVAAMKRIAGTMPKADAVTAMREARPVPQTNPPMQRASDLIPMDEIPF